MTTTETDPGPRDAGDAQGEAPAPPAHRVAMRALTAGPLAGFAAAVAVLLITLAAGEARTRDVVPLLLLGTVSFGAWGATFLVAEGVALHVRPAARLAVLLVVGAGSSALAAGAATWVGALVLQGKSPLDALGEVQELIDHVLARWDRTVPLGAGVLLPFMALGLTRLRGLRRSGQAAGAALTSLLAFLLLCACWGPPSRREVPTIVALFVVAPTIMALGLSLDARIEAWLVARFERWRAAAGGD